MTVGNVYLCSFCDSHLKKSPNRLLQQAVEMEVFSDIFMYDEFDLQPSFLDEFEDMLQPTIRGFGYYVWKPYIILESLSKIENILELFSVNFSTKSD